MESKVSYHLSEIVKELLKSLPDQSIDVKLKRKFVMENIYSTVNKNIVDCVDELLPK